MSYDDTGVRCTMLRGGTSRGLYFEPQDLPADPAERDDLLLRVMGSPDEREIDGIGGGHPLTSKVAVVTPSHVDGVYVPTTVDVDESPNGVYAPTTVPSNTPDQPNPVGG